MSLIYEKNSNYMPLMYNVKICLNDYLIRILQVGDAYEN